MKPRMIFTISAGLSLATSMLSATTGKPATYTASHRQDVSTSVTPQSLSTLMARGEPEPGDKRGKKDDGKGHKFAELMARGEPEPGDKRGKKDDGKGHKFAELMARGEPEPGDKRGKKDDGKGHKFAESLQA